MDPHAKLRCSGRTRRSRKPTFTKPIQVTTPVKSPIHNSLGREATNRRWTRSSGLSATSPERPYASCARLRRRGLLGASAAQSCSEQRRYLRDTAAARPCAHHRPRKFSSQTRWIESERSASRCMRGSSRRIGLPALVFVIRRRVRSAIARRSARSYAARCASINAIITSRSGRAPPSSLSDLTKILRKTTQAMTKVDLHAAHCRVSKRPL